MRAGIGTAHVVRALPTSSTTGTSSIRIRSRSHCDGDGLSGWRWRSKLRDEHDDYDHARVALISRAFDDDGGFS